MKISNFIIIANGCFLVREILVEAIKNKIIIALDGAADKLLTLNIKPHIILGDFDSITPHAQHYWGLKKSFHALSDDDLPYQGNHGVTLVPAKNQLCTDLTKAIHYCDQQHVNSITIVCALGGRLDHHEGNLRSLRSAYKKERPILLLTEQQSIRFAKDETISFSGESGDKCGIVAFPHGYVSSQGLEYEADNFELNVGFSENTCNALVGGEASVTVTGEALLIMPAPLASQREFMEKSEVEQLELLLRDAK